MSPSLKINSPGVVVGIAAHTLYSRLNNKRTGCIILIMQRLHEDDLVGHVLGIEPWTLVKLPAIAEQDETHVIESPYGSKRIMRRTGEALHPEREPLQVLKRIREVQGEYNFSGQYQQAPAPLGGGMVKVDWFKIYTESDRPAKFDLIFQSWDTANKPTELSDFSVCTVWGVKDNHLFLLHVYRKKVGYPDLKRAVKEQADAFGAQTVLIGDKSSGTALIQDLLNEGMHAVKKYEPTVDKIMRMHSVTSTIENGFVHLPERAAWLGEYIHELSSFPRSKYDDQVDSTSQALDWFKNNSNNWSLGVIECEKMEAQKIFGDQVIPSSRQCPNCNKDMNQRIPGGLRCIHCGVLWRALAPIPQTQHLNRYDILNQRDRFRWRPRYRWRVT